MNPSSNDAVPPEQPPDGVSQPVVDPKQNTRSSTKLNNIGKTGGVQKSRPDKGRKPFANININDIDQGSVQFQNREGKTPIVPMEIADLGVKDGSGDANQMPQSPAGRAMIQNPNSPDEYTCTTNSIDPLLHTPIRRLPLEDFGSGNIAQDHNLQKVKVSEHTFPLVDPHLICYDQLNNQVNSGIPITNPHPLTEPIAPATQTDLNHNAPTPKPTPDNNVEMLNQEAANAWTSFGDGKPSFADKIKRTNVFDEIKVEFVKPIRATAGNRRALYNNGDLKHTAQHCSHLLIGYFIGTSMDFKVVNFQLKKLWRSYDLDQISKSNGGIYLIKFKSEQGLDSVLENGPWMVNNIPIILTKWEPGFCVCKPEPSSIPIWVTAHNVPIELWSGRGISKLMSCVGIPLLMDKTTQERCLNPSGKLGYVRVLVEVSADEELPKDIEIEFPPINNRPPRVAKLAVTYQWQPPVCTFCRVFGHTTKLCKIRPPTDEEVQAEKEKKAQEITTAALSHVYEVVDDGFVTVEKKNRRSNNQKTTPDDKLKAPVTESAPMSKEPQQLPSFQNLRTSSDPVVQQKMKELHECFVESLRSTPSTSKPPPHKPTSAQPKKTAYKAVNKNPNSKPKPTHLPKNTLPPDNKSTTASVASTSKTNPSIIPPSHNKFDALANIDADDMVVDMGLQPVASPVKQQIPITKPLQLIDEDTTFFSDDEEFMETDFGITDGKKKMIMDRLTKFKCVRAVDMEGWEPGEWDYFFHQAKILKIDPDYIVEDVAAVDDGTGEFIAEQVQAVFPGRSQMISPPKQQNC
ncbi:hypothetical protein SSX86_027504 [Deinandra increscens subsp. villosa]|uniref:DUF4283 domain-containing protein n=1 Tax=Deinandra increscens subsp. villosa TaxID=3103831 RepID=A0AAP0CGZ5_9ASTR